MTSHSPQHVAIPSRLLDQLAKFRHALIRNVGRDAMLAVLTVAMLVFSVVLVTDRIGDTAASVRVLLLVLILIAFVVASARVWRSIWLSRSPLMIADWIRRGDDVFGDHLVGAIELADSESELARSPALCIAALEQVADEAQERDFHAALPGSYLRVLAWGSLSLALSICVITCVAPSMVFRTAERLVWPLSSLSRYTFVSVDVIPESIVVPRDELSRWSVALRTDSRWHPRQATLSIGTYRSTTSVLHPPRVPRAANDPALSDADRPMQYSFELPRLFEPAKAELRIGDYAAQVSVIPRLRPECVDVNASARLPDYLSHRSSAGTMAVEYTGGQITLVAGAALDLTLTCSSDLVGASVDGQAIAVTGRQFAVKLDADSDRVELDWIDRDGLSAREPLTIEIRHVADGQPTLLVTDEGIPSHVLDSQSLSFSLTAQDDFAIRRVGMQWRSGNDAGERVLGDQSEQSTWMAVFQATALAVPPGQASVRFWVEDDFPGRDRVYSEPFEINVLTPNEHAVWIADQFARWRLSAMDVRDRELNLFSINRELAAVATDRRDQEWRSAVAEQARAEVFNGRQLQALAAEGESLLRQAARNQEVDVDYVEKLAETIKTLEGLAADRMPRIAELLNQAEQAAEDESKFAEMVSQESSQAGLTDANTANGNTADGDTAAEQAESASEKIGLAGTTIVDTSKRSKADAETEASESDALTLAVEDQTDLVAEFDAVAEELKTLLGNMEGSTLVKRLKSVSRVQDRLAMQLGREIEARFGQSAADNRDPMQTMESDVQQSADRVRAVLDDLDAFCKRREIEHFAAVLAEMKQARVLEELTVLKNRLADQPGLSIAVAEYWADNLDRWADDLVDPGSEQTQSGPQNNKSLSPAVVVEVLRILEAEVDLREQTRVAEQGRSAMEPRDYRGEAIRLSQSQDLIRDRLDQVVDGIEAQPEGEVHFAEEIDVLGLASAAMVDATKTLVSPETGPVAIAAQTEAIELLLRSSKVSPQGGEGGGGSAGGGNGGDTDQAAIALLGRALNAHAVARDSDTALSTGRDQGDLPEQWRDGLNEYFNQLERRRSQLGTVEVQ